jgi:hypothetical protein
VERNVESGGEIAAKVTVGIGFFATESMMQMSGVKDEAQFPAAVGECAEECDGVGSAGDTDSEPHAGLRKRSVEREYWLRRAHERMIVHAMPEFLLSILKPC